MDTPEKTTKLTLVKNSLDNFFDPTLILENSYYRVRLVYQEMEVVKSGHKKEKFAIDAIPVNTVDQGNFPYICGTYENPVLETKAARITTQKLPEFKALIDATFDTIDEIRKFLDENY